jgi:hypothetical protein
MCALSVAIVPVVLPSGGKHRTKAKAPGSASVKPCDLDKPLKVSGFVSGRLSWRVYTH